MLRGDRETKNRRWHSRCVTLYVAAPILVQELADLYERKTYKVLNKSLMKKIPSTERSVRTVVACLK